jgi:hypothetical protein
VSAPFTRPPQEFRFNFAGLKTNTAPDQLAPDKYALATNVRSYADGQVRTRPGQAPRFATGGNPILAVRGLVGQSGASGVLAETPRLFAVDNASKVWLDNGASPGTLAAPSPALGFSMIPFRPNASPVPWMYVASFGDYQKFSAPSPTNVVTQAKAGIAEPQSSPDAGVSLPGYVDNLGAAANYIAAGVLAAPADSIRFADGPTLAVVADPVSTTRWSVQVVGLQYGIGATVAMGGNNYLIGDYILPSQAATIGRIQYVSGTTGRCSIVPSGMSFSGTTGGFSGTDPRAPSYLDPSAVNQLRRGALLHMVGETVLVLAVITGPNNQIAIEVSTANNHIAGEAITAVRTLVVDNPAGVAPVTGQTPNMPVITAATTGSGIGTWTRTVSFLSGVTFGGVGPQTTDYLHISFFMADPSKFTEARLQFDVGDGTFTQDYFYYSIRPSDITAGLTAVSTALAVVQTADQRARINAIEGLSVGAEMAPGQQQYVEIAFPIGSLIRVGNNNASIINATKVQIWVNCTAASSIAIGGLSTWGGGQADVGDQGSPLFYRVRPRASTTGVVGNPSPSTRYGSNTRAGQILVSLPSAAYDNQIDTWDVFRYGGTVTSWRFIGSAPSTSATFTDNYGDSAAAAGDSLDFDNFEPWPTIDQPNVGTASVVCGTLAIVSTTDTDITSYLPGTLVLLGGQNAYTLRSRPTRISGFNYLLQFIENAGSAANISYQINEPILANRHLPYVFGPDANGTVFGCGDLFRAGTLSFAKSYAPDSVPDSYNLEVTPPTEPLLGGEVIDGLAYLASPERWWALYFQSNNPAQRYAVVQQPLSRGLAAPFGHCNNGQEMFWWAKDGIWGSQHGSLTDADLYNLFPHEGVPGVAIVYGGVTIQPPAYASAALFRLAYVNGYLHATYVGADSLYHTLVLNLRTMAWSLDENTPRVSVVYHPEQEAGPTQVVGGPFDELIQGNISGQVSAESDGANDLGGAISSSIARAESDGGDARAPKQWGDVFADLTPAAFSGVTITPMSLGAGAVPPIVVPAAATRSRLPLNLGGVFVSDFLGLLFQWTDDYTKQSVPTTLFLAHASFEVQPAKALGFKTFGGSFSLEGYGHIPQIVIAWVSTAAITFTITSFDGQSPAPITIPSSAGAYQKAAFRVSPNKGLLFNFQAVSAAPFQLWLEDSEIWIGAWARTGPYLRAKDFGATSQEAGPL